MKGRALLAEVGLAGKTGGIPCPPGSGACQSVAQKLTFEGGLGCTQWHYVQPTDQVPLSFNDFDFFTQGRSWGP